jgi:zinc protease
MIIKYKLLAVLAMLISPVVFAQKLVEKVEKKEGELSIPYQKYVFKNGLTVLIHEDHSDPLVHIDVTYHVGSAREEIGKSGFAHFFEHMMFQGSEHVGDEEHFRIISEAGGTLNGTTNKDRTNYFETMPRNQLETGLWLEADRMGFLLEAVTQEKFEIQRATVKNERGQNYDNRPYGLVGETISKNLYPYGHPYSWLTIGYIEDLNRVNVDDLKKFFMRWYGPNNAVLTVGGDVDTKEVLKLVNKYFGPIPKGKEVEKAHMDAPVLTGDRYISMEDNIRFPLLQVVFPSVPNYHPDEPALDILASIMGDGKNSIFYKNFIKTSKALSADVSHPCYELAGEFTMRIVAYPGQRLSEIDSMVRSSIAEFESRGVNPDDLQRAKAGIESGLINSLESVSGKVSQLASWQTFTGNPNRIAEVLSSYNKVTAEDVMRVYQQYIKGKHAVILSAYPKGERKLIAAEDNYNVSKDQYKPGKDEYAKLKYKRPKTKVDLSRKPEAGAAPVVTPPVFYEHVFPNGVRLIGTENQEVPVVNIQIRIAGGHMLEQKDRDKAGISRLTAALMNEGTKNFTAEAFSNELEKLGTTIRVSSGEEHIMIEMSSLSKNLDASLRLLEDRLLNPRFTQEDFDRLKNEQIQAIANQATQPTVIANRVYARLIYGDHNIRSVSELGTAETLKNITLGDINNFYNQNYIPWNAKVIISGNLKRDELFSRINFLSAWPAKGTTPAPAHNRAVRAPRDITKIYLVDKPGAPQSELRLGYMSMPFDATGEYFMASVMNYALGGSFNSRINLNLREKRGFTYGARTGFHGTKLPGPFTGSAGVIGSKTDSSVAEFIKEIRQYREGVTEKEVAFTRNSFMTRDALKYETNSQKAGFLAQIQEYNLMPDFLKQQQGIIERMTVEQMTGLANRFLEPDKMIIVVVGDAKSIRPGLEGLGYPVVELDKDGNTLRAVPAPER